MLPENVQTRICYTGTKLGTKFNNIEDPVKIHVPNQAVQKITLAKQVED